MKTALVSQILPATNYSRYLANALGDCLVYTDKRTENLHTELRGRVRLTFTKNSLKYPFEILKQARKDHIELIHLQHEFNMFGTKPVNAIEFLILPPLLRLFGIKVVTTVHGVVAPNQVDLKFLETFGWPAKKYWVFPIKIFLYLLYSLTCFFSQKVIVHSPALKNILTKHYFASKKKIATIPHGIPSNVNIKGGKKVENINKPYLFYFGYFHRRKGLDDLVKAFKIAARKNPKLTLVLAGGCLQKDFENQIRDLVTKLGLEKKVIFTDFVEEDELRWLLSNCLMVVLPLTYSISASGPLAQAIAHHKPIITTDLGVSSKEIINDKTGLLVSPRNHVKLAEAIAKLTKNKKLQKTISKNLEQMQKERSWDKIAQETKKIYSASRP